MRHAKTAAALALAALLGACNTVKVDPGASSVTAKAGSLGGTVGGSGDAAPAGQSTPR